MLIIIGIIVDFVQSNSDVVFLQKVVCAWGQLWESYTHPCLVLSEIY